MVSLVEDGIDLAVRIGDLADSSLVARHVGEMRRIVVASPAYLKARGEPKTPGGHRLPRHHPVRRRPRRLRTGAFSRTARRFASPTRRGFSTNSSDAAVQYAEAGGGLTRVLAYQAAASLKAGRLKIVLEKFELPALPIHIVYPTSRLLSAKVRTFIDLVVETTDWHFG